MNIIFIIPKNSGTERHEFILLREKKDLLDSLEHLIKEVVVERVTSTNYMEGYIKLALSLIHQKLKTSFKKISNEIDCRTLVINISDIAIEIENQERISKSKVMNVMRYAEVVIALWLYWFCANCYLSKQHVHPRLSLNIKSKFIQRNSHLIKSDLSLLALYGSSDSSLELLEELNLISENNKALLSDFIAYFKKNSTERSNYRPSSAYTFREYVLKHGALGPVEYFDFLRVRDQLIESTGVEYAESPFIALLSKYNLVFHRGRPRTHSSLIHFQHRDYETGFSAKALRKKKRHQARKLTLASSINGSKLEIGKTYSFKNIYLSLSEEFDGHLIFSIARTAKKLYFNPDVIDSDFSEKFLELAAYQRDFLKFISQKRRNSSIKVYKQSLRLINEYLVEFVYPISISNNLHFFDVSGENFTKTELYPLFSNSEILVKSFERKYGANKIPLSFKDWLYQEKEESALSLFNKLSAIEKFFKFVETTSKGINKNYNSPIPIDFTKSTSKKYLGTTKKILDVKEWLIFIDILDCLINVSLKRKYLSLDTEDVYLAKAFVEAFDSELLKRKYDFSLHLPENIFQSALELYKLQYAEGSNQYVVLPNSASFWASISCLYIIVNTGLRNNSAVNLQLNDLIEFKGDKFTSIKVIQDKTDPNGFKSMIPTPVLNKVLELRKSLLIQDESFYGLRTVDRGNGVYDEYEGLLGASSKIDESTVSIVADFVFYLYNEIARYLNKIHKFEILQEIKIRPFTNVERRGVGEEKKLTTPPNAYAISIADVGSKTFKEISSELSPLVQVRFKPDLTVHSLRATFVTTAHLAGVSEQVIKACTGQEPVTQSHYIKATAMNMEYLASGAKFELIEKLLRNEPGIRPLQPSDVDIMHYARSGIVRSGGLSCSLKGILNTDDIEQIYRSNYKNVSIHPTHICPHNDECPTYILEELNYEKNCAICPVSISFTSDIPAISQKIRFHIDEAQTLKKSEKLLKGGHKTNEVAWMTHFKEAANWLARYDLLMDSNGIVAGENTIRDSENALAKFTCEDNDLLNDLLRMIETRGYNSYQSGKLKAKAIMIQMQLAPNLDGLNTEILIQDPVESLCRTLDKILMIHNVGLDEVVLRLSSDSPLFKNKDVIDALLIGGKNE